MKELSIEQKARAYDEAIERAKSYYNATENNSLAPYLEIIFPELIKESEDERIRRNLLEEFKSYNDYNRELFEGITVNDIIVWLEKQKSTVDINDVCEWLQKYAKCYVNGNYNHYLQYVEYDGTIDVDSMIERLKYNFK